MGWFAYMMLFIDFGLLKAIMRLLLAIQVKAKKGKIKIKIKRKSCHNFFSILLDMVGGEKK